MFRLYNATNFELKMSSNVIDLSMCFVYKTRSHTTWTNVVADVYVTSVKRFLQTTQTFILLS